MGLEVEGERLIETQVCVCEVNRKLEAVKGNGWRWMKTASGKGTKLSGGTENEWRRTEER